MENENIYNIPEQNTHPVAAHFDIKLEGWPAATSIMAVCLSGVALYGIYAFSGKTPPFPRIA